MKEGSIIRSGQVCSTALQTLSGQHSLHTLQQWLVADQVQVQVQAPELQEEVRSRAAKGKAPASDRQSAFGQWNQQGGEGGQEGKA